MGDSRDSRTDLDQSRLAASIYLTVPPYLSCPAMLRMPKAVVPGSVLFLDLDWDASLSLRRSFPYLVSYIDEIQYKLPSLAIAVRLDPVDQVRAFRVARRLSLTGVRLLLTTDPSGPALRSAALISGFDPGDVGRWLRRQIHPKGIVERGTVQVLRDALMGKEAGRTTKYRASRWARQMGLPSHRQWIAAGRVTRALVLLQSRSPLPVSVAAERVGYADVTSLSHACRRVVGQSASVARRWIGWEWILAGFLGLRGCDGFASGRPRS